LTNPSSLDKYDTLIVPVSEYMDPEEQELLIEKIKAGINLIFVGLVPRYDLRGANCTLLSSFLKVKSSSSFEVAEIKYDSITFPTLLYGTLTSSDPQAKTIAKSRNSSVAMRLGKFEGKVFFMSFDLSTQYYHTKMGFLELILQECSVKPFIYTSNPDVRAILRTDNKRALLYLLYSKPQLPFKKVDRHSLNLAVKVDLKQVGIKTAKLGMIELFSGDKEVITSKKLADGFITEFLSLDSRVWLIAPAQKPKE